MRRRLARWAIVLVFEYAAAGCAARHTPVGTGGARMEVDGKVIDWKEPVPQEEYLQ